MKPQRPIATDDEHRVLEFRPRNALHSPELRKAHQTARHRQLNPSPQLIDLSRYDEPRDAPDDFRHRMLANIAAFAVTVALAAIGIWLAMSIADLRKTQECALMGWHDCIHKR